MKRLLLSLTALLTVCFSAEAQEEKKYEHLNFVDATTLNICGHTQRTDKSPYHRFDWSLYGFQSEIIRRYATYSTGLYVMFRTNSTTIAATWENGPCHLRTNTTVMAQMGLDLYVKENGKWRYCQVGIPAANTKITKRTRTLIENMSGKMREYMLYLPLFCEIKSLSIGVDKDAKIEAIPSPYKYKVINYGTSITHGVAVSRPAMTWPARMSRNLGIEFVNAGFSGQGKMQPTFVSLFTQCEADAFLCYCFGNPTTKQIEERVDFFVDELVKAHPGKPIIFIKFLHEEAVHYDLKKRATIAEKSVVVERKMAEICKRHKDVYYLNEPFAYGEDYEGIADLSHITDQGFDNVVKTYQSKIAEILRKYGIE